MIIKKLYLENFLSYKKQYAEFYEGLNVIAGANAAGKTNLVESVYFSSLGKSSRNYKDKELINWDAKEKNARIRLSLKKKYSEHIIDIHIDGDGKKRIAVDSLPIERLGELIGIINIVFFSPGEMGLVKESPVDRRRFMDISLCQQNKIYFYSLMKYNKLLAQRNKVFKTCKNDANLKEMVELVTESMLECEKYIMLCRKEFIEKLSPVSKNEHLFVTGDKEELELIYATEEIDYSDIKGSLKKLYAENYEKDVKMEYTTIGIHRDDIKILINGIDVRKFGSQGQQRTVVLSLKLAEMAMFFEKTGEQPILILDDVLSELDVERKKALFSRIQGVQTLVTCTEFDLESTEKYRMFLIKDKSIKEIKDIKNV